MPRRLLVLVAVLVAGVARGAEPTTDTEAGAHRSHHSHHHAVAHHPTHRPSRHEIRHDHRPVVAPPAATVARPVPPAPPPAPPKPPVGSSTGLPLPRFASLRADEVNLRAGPGTQYPIQWVFKHQNMPVEIQREFDVWRLIAAPDGTVGWVHQATLIGTRTFTVPDGAGTVALRHAADPNAPVVAELEPGAIGRILRCDAGAAWCRVGVRDYQGFVPRDAMWGMLPNEAIGVPTP